MNELPRLYLKSRNEWRAWLKKYHNKKNVIWLVYYKKHTAKPTIAYEEAVEEALCFGWIDSTIKRIDKDRYVQKFTPRRRKSRWSFLNIQRARKMIQQRKMTKAGLVFYKEIMKKPIKDTRTAGRKKVTIPKDLKEALTKNKKAYRNFKNFAPSYQKMYIGYVGAAKKAETRKRRIRRVVAFAFQDKKSVML